MKYYIYMLVYILVMFVGIIRLTSGARYNLVGHMNQPVQMQLKSQYDIEPATVLKLPIDVDKEYLSLFGTLPPRLIKITTSAAPGVYGAGDLFYISLQFSTSVDVKGSPYLVMNTGCDSPSCQVKEIQTFTCTADQGMFALRLEDQFIMNIDANTTQDQLKSKLEELVGITDVTVHYYEADDREYSFGRRACTSKGNKVTITFENVSFPQYNGNVPELQYDVSNKFADLRTRLSQGTPLKILAGINDGYIPSITSDTIRNGYQKADTVATYFSGSGTDTIIFRLLIQFGDSTPSLEAKAINFDQGSIVSPYTGATVSTAVPFSGSGVRYMFAQPSSLSFNKKIAIVNAFPRVAKVTSPNSEGIYTEGDEVLVHVYFDLPIKIFGKEKLYIQLQTGVFNRLALFNNFIGNNIIEFKYIVGFKDYAGALDVLTTDSFFLNGAIIYRNTLANSSLANVTLPQAGSANSLTRQKHIVISNSAPVILSMEAISKAGTWTAGDYIDVLLTYDTPVAAIGPSRLWIKNSARNLNGLVKHFPANPAYTYTRATPQSSAQITLTFTLNFDLAANDVVYIYLPTFYIKEVDPVANPTRALTVLTSTSYGFTAIWRIATSVIELTSQSNIPAGTSFDAIFGAKHGIFPPSIGVSNNYIVRYDVRAASVANSLSQNLKLSSVSSIGFTHSGIDIRPFDHKAENASVVLSFSVPELLSVGDVIAVTLPNFIINTAQRQLAGVIAPFVLTSYDNKIFLAVSQATMQLSFNVEMSRVFKMTIPDQGVTYGSAQISGWMATNGIISSYNIPQMNNICGFQKFSLDYVDRDPGQPSGINIEFEAGPTDLTVGDVIVIYLPAWDTSTGEGVRHIAWQAGWSPDWGEFFSLSIIKGVLYFQLKKTMPAFRAISIQIPKAVGLFVHMDGFTEATKVFVHIQGYTFNTVVFKLFAASSCGMNSPMSYPLLGKAIFIALNKIATITPRAPSVNMINAEVDLTFAFNIRDSLIANDRIIITVPGFSLMNQLVPTIAVTAVSSAISVSGTFDAYMQTLTFTLNNNFILTGSTAVSLRVTMRSPSTSIDTNIFTLSIISARSLGGTLLNSPFVNQCSGFCASTGTYSTSFVGEPVVASMTLTHSVNIPVNSQLRLYLADLGAFGGAASLNGYVEYQTSLPYARTAFTNRAITAATSTVEAYITVPIPTLLYAGERLAIVVTDLLYPNTAISRRGLRLELSLGVTVPPSPTPLSSIRFRTPEVLPDMSKASIGISFDNLNPNPNPDIPYENIVITVDTVNLVL